MSLVELFGLAPLWVMITTAQWYLFQRHTQRTQREFERQTDTMRRDSYEMRQEISTLREQVRQFASAQESMRFREEARVWEIIRPTLPLKDEPPSVEKSDVAESRMARTRFDRV